MLKLAYHKLNLPFEYPFITAKGEKHEQPSLVVSLGLGRLKGWGEATAIPYHQVDIDQLIELLEAKRPLIEKYALTDPERFWHFLHHLLPQHPFLVAALDCSAWDLWAKLRDQKVHECMNIDWQEPIPLTDYTIGITQPEKIKERLGQKVSPIYKIKLGSENDAEMLQILSQYPDKIFRIDVNEGWTWEAAEKLIPFLNAVNIDLIEQPFHKEDTEALQKFKQQIDVTVIADEACQSEKDLEKCLPLYDGINIKLAKCSGITPAWHLLKKIKAQGKKVMLGGMCESVIGAAALAQLLPLADYADIDGPLLLKENNATGLHYNAGKISLGDDYGLGINVDFPFEERG